MSPLAINVMMKRRWRRTTSYLLIAPNPNKISKTKWQRSSTLDFLPDNQLREKPIEQKETQGRAEWKRRPPRLPDGFKIDIVLRVIAYI
jgi:hypothetical protein